MFSKNSVLEQQKNHRQSSPIPVRIELLCRWLLLITAASDLKMELCSRRPYRRHIRLQYSVVSRATTRCPALITIPLSNKRSVNGVSENLFWCHNFVTLKTQTHLFRCVKPLFLVHFRFCDVTCADHGLQCQSHGQAWSRW